jgi:hypothetical protein
LSGASKKQPEDLSATFALLPELWPEIEKLGQSLTLGALQISKIHFDVGRFPNSEIQSKKVLHCSPLVADNVLEISVQGEPDGLRGKQYRAAIKRLEEQLHNDQPVPAQHYPFADVHRTE